MGTRLDRLRAELTDRGIDAMLISCTVNQSWCCGFDFEDGYLLVCEKRAYLITDPRYIEAAVAEAEQHLHRQSLLKTIRRMKRTRRKIFQQRRQHRLSLQPRQLKKTYASLTLVLTHGRVTQSTLLQKTAS